MTPTDASSSRPSDGSGSEPDPTGMRALLSSLPDPGPMPEDLVRRIEARLAVEAHAASAAGSGDRSADRLVDLAAERSSRRPARTVALLGVAAAGLLATTLGIGQLVDGGLLGSRTAPDSAASYPTGTSTLADDDEAMDMAGAGADDAADGAGPEQAGGDVATEEMGAAGSGADDGSDADAGSEEAAAALAAPAGMPGELVVLPALGEVTTEDYRERLEARAGSPATPSADLTREEVEACWSATGSPHRWDTLHAARADLDEQPTVVLVARSGDRGESFLLPFDCTSPPGTGDPLHTTVPLDHVVWDADD